MTGTPESAVPDQSQSRGAWFLRRALLVACGVSAIILLTRTPHLEPALSQMRAIAAAQGPTGMLGFGAAYVVAALLFVPGAALTTLAGGLFGVAWGMVIVAIATSAADATSFLIGRYVARDLVKRLTSQYPRFGAIDLAITQGGWRIVALLRLSPTIPYSASNYLYGLTGIPFLPYLLASGAFTLPGTFVYVYLGYVSAETLGGCGRSPVEWILLGLGVAATLAATIYVTVLGRRALAELRSR